MTACRSCGAALCDCPIVLADLARPMLPHERSEYPFRSHRSISEIDVDDRQTKLRALFNVLGHSIARFPDGRTVQVTPGALVDISLSHRGASA